MISLIKILLTTWLFCALISCQTRDLVDSEAFPKYVSTIFYCEDLFLTSMGFDSETIVYGRMKRQGDTIFFHRNDLFRFRHNCEFSRLKPLSSDSLLINFNEVTKIHDKQYTTPLSLNNFDSIKGHYKRINENLLLVKNFKNLYFYRNGEELKIDIEFMFCSSDNDIEFDLYYPNHLVSIEKVMCAISDGKKVRFLNKKWRDNLFEFEKVKLKGRKYPCWGCTFFNE